MQRVEAVANDALYAADLVNVIVFPRRGDRDLASKLGGGDLVGQPDLHKLLLTFAQDGDDYTLIWDTLFTSELAVTARVCDSLI